MSCCSYGCECLSWESVIPCLAVWQLLIFISCNVFKIVQRELSPTPLRSHTLRLLGKLSIGCLLSVFNTALLVYSSYIVIISAVKSFRMLASMFGICISQQLRSILIVVIKFSNPVKMLKSKIKIYHFV